MEQCKLSAEGEHGSARKKASEGDLHVSVAYIILASPGTGPLL